jgi:hypothetical protein
MIKIKNWQALALLVILFFAGQIAWYLTSKGII